MSDLGVTPAPAHHGSNGIEQGDTRTIEKEQESLQEDDGSTVDPVTIHVTSDQELEKPLSPDPEQYHEIQISPLPTPQHAPQEQSPTRARSDSQSTMATTNTTRPIPKSSLLFVVSSLESIAASKDARRSKELSDSLQRALNAIKTDANQQHLSPEILFEPLQLASQTPNVQVVTTALDCIGKLISYSYFSLPSQSHDEQEGPPLIEQAIDTICDCFQSEATPVETQLQIVKSLLSAILNDKIVVHGAGLLKAVRMTYNIFLLSKASANQTVAQGALTQMVGTVFERVKLRLELKEARLNAPKPSSDHDSTEDLSAPNGSGIMDGDLLQEQPRDADMDDTETVSSMPSDAPVEKRDAPKITLQSFENRKSFDDGKITEAAPTLVTRIKHRRTTSRHPSGANGAGEHEPATEDEEDEIYIKDAYLVFRAMCRLNTKPLPMEHALDVKSQGMRSKLISLHIIHTI